jgi:hypothetical protein
MSSKILAVVLFAVSVAQAAKPSGWSIGAAAKGPNQINLTWGAVQAPGYGYIVEVQSDTDTRYRVFTEVKPVPDGRGYVCNPNIDWLGAGTGCTVSDPNGAYIYNLPINGVPVWVTEPQYIDPQDGTRAQFLMAGLRSNTKYSFRVRTFTGMTQTIYGAYSSVATATTANYPIRWISPTGNDANSGTAADDAHAWRTLGKAGAASCGTLVLVKGGNYANEHFFWRNQCSAGAKLVVQANYGEKPKLVSNSHPDWNGAFNLSGSYVVVDGLSFSEEQQTGYVMVVAGDHNALFNLNVGPDRVPTSYGGVSLQGSYLLLYGCWIHDFGSPDVRQNDSGGGGFALEIGYGGGHNMVWSNHISRGAHDTTLIKNSSWNTSLNNTYDGGWGMAFETVYGGSQHNLFEGAIGRYPGRLEAAYKPNFELSYSNNTVRRGVFMDAVTAIEISAYDDARYNLVYNNVFWGVGTCYFQSHNGGPIMYDGVKVQNNICRTTMFNTDAAMRLYVGNTTQQAIANNSVVKIGGGPGPVIWNQDGGSVYAYPVSLDFAERNYGAATSTWDENAILSQKELVFADPGNMDFHLLPNSGLVSTGLLVADPDWAIALVQKTVDLGIFGLR